MKIKNINLGIANFLDDRPKLKKFLPQALTLFVIIFIFGFFTFNAQVNMGNRGIEFGFGFLSQESSFDIQFHLIDYDGSYSYARAYLVGLLNTILVSVIGIFFATIIGVIVGISRLSTNYLVSKFAETYVEIFRNIPLLLQIFFWYFAALRALPLPQEAINLFDVTYLTVKGWFVPRFIWTNLSIFIYSVILSLVVIFFIFNYARKKQEATGQRIPAFLISLAVIILFPLIAILLGGVGLSFEYPKLIQQSPTIFIYSVILSSVVIFFIFSYAKKKQEATGQRIPAFLISLAVIILFPAITILLGGVGLSFEYPKLIQQSPTIFNFSGGVGIIPELIALALALSLYTATFIAECVRAGIMGVGKGQKEAAASIGLTPGQTLRLVVMPQALRIIIPPTTNQYLNLTKNSSLAAAIAYPDLVLVFAGTAMMQTGRAIEIVSITMLTYLTLSILISIFMNWYNKKIAIKEK